MVSVSDSGMTKVCGKIGVGHAHVRELVRHRAQRRELQAPGLGLERDLRLVELPHDPRHRPALAALELALAGAAELLARGVVADGVQRGVVQEAVQERGMRRVDADLEGLQPVGVPQALEGEGVGRRARRSSRTAGRAAARCPARRTSRTGCRFVRPPDSCAAAPARTACCRWARRAFPGRRRRRRTSSRGTGSAGRRLRAGRRTGRRRGAGSRGRAGPSGPAASRNSTRSWPSTRTALTGRCAMRGSSAGSNSSTSATGCQYRRSTAPQGVPGPMRVTSSFCSAFMGSFETVYRN